MTTFELKVARAIAEDTSIDLSRDNCDVLFGFGLTAFAPVTVSLRVVANCMRWQCLRWDGGWDEHQFNEDRPHYLRNVIIADLTTPEMQKFLVEFCVNRLQDQAA